MNASTESQIDRRQNLFAAWFKPNRPSRSVSRGRKLRIETLESRLALASAPLAADVSLADYLAQTPEMGPLLPPVAETSSSVVPALDVASLEAADALAADLAASPVSPPAEELFGEGESVSPTILTFEVIRVDAEYVRLFGTVSDNDPAQVTVYFGDLFAGESTTSDGTGNFNVYVQDPGFLGIVTARAMDDEGNSSALVLRFLS